MAAKEKIERRPNLSLLAMISFVASFAVARVFTTLNPATVLTPYGVHVHHFWYGLAMLAIGGWLGISYHSERIDRLAAILFGAGGGIVGDEFGLLLTLENYWTEITYTFVIVFVTTVSMLILFFKYSKAIGAEFASFLRSNASLYIGVFLAVVSTALALQTDNATLIIISSIVATIAYAIVLAYFGQRIRLKRK